MIKYICLGTFAAVACVTALGYSASRNDDKIVDVTITAKAPDGTVLDGMSVQLFAAGSRNSPPSGITEQNGECTVPVQVSDGISVISVGIGYAPMLHGPKTDPQIVRIRALLDQYCWPVERRVTIGASEESAIVEFRAVECITIRGRLVGVLDTSGIVVHLVGNIMSGASVQQDGTFVIAKAPRGKKSAICIATKANWPGSCRVIEVSAAQSVTDVNLGDIQSPAATLSTAPIRLEMSDATALRGSGARIAAGVTLVSDDGQTVMSYSLAGGSTVNVDGTTQLGNGIPPGGYFVAPVGLTLGGGEKLIALVRAGRAAELTAANFPHFTAVSGQAVTYSWTGSSSWELLLQLESDW